MPSTETYTNRIPNGGFNRAAAPQAAGEGNWYDLLNLRPLMGQLVSTPLFIAKYALSLLSGESAGSRIHYMDIVQGPSGTIEYLVVNESNARYVLPSNLTGSQTKLPCVIQTKVPNNITSTGYAVLSGINTTDFSSDGDYFTFVITSTNTLQWSKNGGGTHSVTISANDVGIGSNGLVISFFTNTGFTNGDTWQWTRQALIPYNAAETTTNNFAYNPAVYQTDLYLGGVGRNVLRVRSGLITSVGYNRIYGKYVNIFCNHLVVGHFAQGVYDAVNGVVDSFNPAVTPYTVGWSDLNNPDDMVPEEPNTDSEADSYFLPYNTYPDAVNYGITGMAQLYGTLYIYLPDAIYQMQYVGLPAVMQILPRFQGTGCYYPNSLVLAKRGHYFLGRDNVYFFNGLIPTPIGEPVRTKFYAELPGLGTTRFDLVYGYYNADEQEVVWHYETPVGIYQQARECVYMEKYSRFYFRNCPSADSGATQIMCEARVFESNTLPRQIQYGGNQEVYFDYNANETYANAVKDVVGATPSMTQPYAETNDLFYGSVPYKKDPQNLFVDSAWGSVSTTSTVTALQCQVSSRNFLSNPVAYTNLPVYNQGLPEQGIIPVKGSQTGARYIRYNFTWQTTTGAVGIVLAAWSDSNYGTNRQISK